MLKLFEDKNNGDSYDLEDDPADRIPDSALEMIKGK